MNLNLQKAIIKYARDGHGALSAFLFDLSKDDHMALTGDLLNWYFNDKNSSSLREYVTAVLCGYTHQSQKLGYNGFKQLVPGKTVHCEVKPANFDTEELERYKKKNRKTPPARLSAGGSINDYTFARLEKDKNANLNLLISGFVDGRLMYIFEVPFNTPTLTDHLMLQLKKRFPGGEDIPSEYLRGASFNYKHYQDSENLKVCYMASADVLEANKFAFQRDLYPFLLTHAGLSNED